MIVPHTDQVTDEYGRPVPGASIYVTDTLTLDPATLTLDGTTSLTQPLTADQFGFYTYWAAEGIYREDIYYGGRLREKNLAMLGTPPQLKGNPGGNILATGLFVAGPSFQIPAGTDIIRTTGFSTNGLGAAYYFHDPAVDAAYVAAQPWTSFISNDGGVSAPARGWRLDTTKGLDFFQTGSLADSHGPGTGTDNYAPIMAAVAALGRGGALRMPDGGDYFFRCSQSPVFTSGIKLIGDGFHENPGIVNGVSYPIPRNYSGSVICLDADVPGPVFSAFTDNNASSYAFEFQSSELSICRDVMFLGGGGTSTTAHGVDIYSQVRFNNVRIYGFAGNGININANTAGAFRYGNADISQFYGVISQYNKGHGIFLGGNDANVIMALGCNFNNNGGCGSLDTTPVGNNLFIGCHYSVNNRSFGTPTGFSAAQRSKVVADAPCLSDQYTGSAVQYRLNIYDGTDIGNESSYVCCYAEGGTGSKARLRNPTKVDRGFLSESGFWHGEFTAQVDGGDILRNYNNIVAAAGILKVAGDVVRFTSRDDADTYASVTASGIDIDAGGVLTIGGVKVVGPRQTAPAYPSGGSVIDVEARAAITSILNLLTINGTIG